MVTNGVNGINTITYSDKSINQFLNCTGIGNSIRSTDDLRSDEFIFGYENGDLTKRVELRITGVLSNFELLPSSGSSVTLEGEKITVRNLGEEIQNPTLPSDKSRKTVFFNSWIYNTASRIKLDIPAATPVPGTTSDFNHKSKIDKSQLKTGDKVSVFRRGEFIPIETDVTVTVGTNDIGLGVSFTNDGITEYDIQRQLVKANAASDIDLQFGNNIITTDVQNTYNDEDENYYVASSSMPSYLIEKKVIKETLGSGIGTVHTSAGIPQADYFATNGQNFQLLERNLTTGLYSKLQFNTAIDFITGDAIVYLPNEEPLVGLSTSAIYYVEVLSLSLIHI